MSKTKIEETSIFKIIFNSILIYLKNFAPLSKAMLFPVFGQLIGIALILYPTFRLSENAAKVLENNFINNNIALLFLGLLLIIIPGFIIFFKAFWEYLVVMTSLNSMIAEIKKQGSLKSFKTWNQIIKLRSRSYIALISLLSLIWVIGLSLPVIIIAPKSLSGFGSLSDSLLLVALELISVFIISIISIYLSLSYQVFAFENLSPLNTFKKSWLLVEGNFWRTFILGCIVSAITGLLVPGIFQALIANTPLMSFTVSLFRPFVEILGTNFINKPDMAYEISGNAASIAIATIITAFMLPLGSACYTLLYFDIVNRKTLKSKKKVNV